MKIPSLTIQQLLEAGVHLGHKTLRWNPKMKKYIFGKRDSIHIIDLTQTLELTNVALEKVYNTITNNGKILFVSTKKQASEAIAEVAKETGQYFVNYRWLGGMLTNWGTISGSIKKMKKYEADLVAENRGFTKKELLKMSVKKDKLERALGGIAEMKKIPDLVFIIDTNYESLAIAEASKLGIPICAILDSNSDPDGIEFPIPGNDDARRAIDLYCNLVKETIENAKKAAPSKSEEKPQVEDAIKKEKSTKTVQELDREKLDAKFLKKEKVKLH
jgi:small subunit ribosomal protein S2